MDALVMAGRFYATQSGKQKLSEDELVNLAIEQLGLSQLYPFNPEEKIIEYLVKEKGPLASVSVKGFLSELASNSPAPGGGSVAALSGALGAALSSMVCNLTLGKEKYQQVQNDIKAILGTSEQLRNRLTALIDEDTSAFNEVMTALKMPKDTPAQKQKRSAAMQQGFKTAAEVPLETAQTCEKVLDLALVVAKKGNQNSITDAAVSALMASAGVDSAVLNVQINLGSINDATYVQSMTKKLNTLQQQAKEKTMKVLAIVEQHLSN
jgi:glutamate formiminotransferase/formiminotetrahydrofolate cyclodeaminase